MGGGPFKFIAAGVLALIVLGGGVALFGSQIVPLVASSDGCEDAVPVGDALTPERVDSDARRDGEKWTREVTFRVDAGDTDAGTLRACTNVGDVVVVPSPDAEARVVFTIRAIGTDAGRAAVESAAVEARFARDARGLAVSAWHARGDASTAWWAGSAGGSVTVRVELPTSHRWGVHAVTGAGDVTLRDLHVAALDIAGDVADVTVSGVDLAGDARVASNVGEVNVTLTGVGAGTLHARVDVGDVSLAIPAREDVGYDVTARADVGSVRVDVPDAETTDRRSQGPSESERARSVGFEERPTRVTVHASVDVGHVRVAATDA